MGKRQIVNELSLNAAEKSFQRLINRSKKVNLKKKDENSDVSLKKASQFFSSDG